MFARLRLHVRHAFVLLCTSALALGVIATADAEKRQINAADQKTAKRMVLVRSDLPGGFKWKGGFQKPDDSAISCPGFHPKTSDLTITGEAATGFSAAGAHIDSSSQVLETTAMADHDWARTITPKLLPCFRQQLAKSKLVRIVSTGRLHIPGFGARAWAGRVVYDLKLRGAWVPSFVDLVAVAGGRQELSLSLAGYGTGTGETKRRTLQNATIIDTALVAAIVHRAFPTTP